MNPYVKICTSVTILSAFLLPSAHASPMYPSPALDRASKEVAARRLSPTNTLDCMEVVRDMESIAATNLALAVEENNFERINEIYAKMMLIANTPSSNRLHWAEAEPGYVRIEYRILQAVFEMRAKWTRPDPLLDASVLAGTRYAPNTPAEDISDPELKKRYKEWLEYAAKHRDKVRYDGILENHYRQKKWMLSVWLLDEKYIPVIQEAVTNKALLKQLFPPTGIPRVMSSQLTTPGNQ